MADELARAGALLPESSTVELDMPLASFKLAIVRKFVLDANLVWINEKFCSTARLTWPVIDRKRTSQLLGLDRDIISATVSMLAGHCVMSRQVERMRLLFNYFCRGYRSAEKEETIIHLFCQCPPLLFVNLTELPSV